MERRSQPPTSMSYSARGPRPSAPVGYSAGGSRPYAAMDSTDVTLTHTTGSAS